MCVVWPNPAIPGLQATSLVLNSGLPCLTQEGILEAATVSQISLTLMYPLILSYGNRKKNNRALGQVKHSQTPQIFP